MGVYLFFGLGHNPAPVCKATAAPNRNPRASIPTTFDGFAFSASSPGFQDFRRYEWSDRLWVELALVSYLTGFGHGLSWFGASMAASLSPGYATPWRPSGL